MREFDSINQLKMRTRGRGSKNPKLLRMSFMEPPDCSFRMNCPIVDSALDLGPLAYMAVTQSVHGWLLVVQAKRRGQTVTPPSCHSDELKRGKREREGRKGGGEPSVQSYLRAVLYK